MLVALCGLYEEFSMGIIRKSNFELLRIILMISIPIFHLVVYNGVFYFDNSNAYWSLALSVGGAIPADYAFMAMSAYFLVRKKESNLKKFVVLLFQVACLFVVKYLSLGSLFGFSNRNYYVDIFLMKGAWWYIYPYLVISLIYPFINKFIEIISIKKMYIITACLGVIVCAQAVINNPNFVQDLIAFIFTYMLFAYFKEKGDDVNKTRRKHIIFLIVLCELVMLIVVFTAKAGIIGITEEASYGLIRFVIGRYHPVSIVMGYALFFLFKDIDIGYSKAVNRIASVTFYVFLLHDTIMGIFWYFGKCDGEYGSYSTGEFFIWMLIYVLVCFVLCGLFQLIYENTLLRVFKMIIDKLVKANDK